MNKTNQPKTGRSTPFTCHELLPGDGFTPAPVASKYQQQAQAFLDKFGIKFRATLSDSKVSPWAMKEKPFKSEPHHFRVTLSKQTKGGNVPLNFGPRFINKQAVSVKPESSRLTFDFWSSIADSEKGIRTIDAYDVLACISSGTRCPETFKDFCGEFGEIQNSIKALQAFRRCSVFAKRLQAFFTPAELEALQEIN